ncbi:MAG: hypothetical protein ACTSW1_10810 [Candidatus Hodarchaeales archaeon]
MFFADAFSEGLAWWGEQLYNFMKLLPPTDWLTSPLYELKLVIYFVPIIFLLLLPWILYLRCSMKKKNLSQPKIQVISSSFRCQHCGYVPEYPPEGGTFYCPKCGKTTNLNNDSKYDFK